jgi:hypothetical protein
MEEDLLDGVGDVGAGGCQVPEGPGKALELSGISNRRLGSRGDLGLCVHGHRDRLAVHHASMLKDIKRELALSEEDSICLMLYGDPPKMVKMVELLHSKFPFEGRFGVLQEHYTRCGVHIVINI